MANSRLNLLLFAVLQILVLQEAHAVTTGYELILTIVIVEVIFSFVIGVVCIILSFNLFRALKDSPNVYTGMPVGEFPLSRGASNTNVNGGGDSDRASDAGRSSTPHSPADRETGDYSTFRDPRITGSFGSEAEMDFEGVADGSTPQLPQNNLLGVVKSVTGYLRLW